MSDSNRRWRTYDDGSVLFTQQQWRSYKMTLYVPLLFLGAQSLLWLGVCAYQYHRFKDVPGQIAGIASAYQGQLADMSEEHRKELDALWIDPRLAPTLENHRIQENNISHLYLNQEINKVMDEHREKRQHGEAVRQLRERFPVSLIKTIEE